MPAKKFRFVSPGVQIKEIDKSQLPREPQGVGPVVIGRTLRGPGMVPVTVNSYEEFIEKFGAPDRGAGSSDVWRNGNTTAPTYAAYAAEAYLKNSSPLTMVRLLGTQHNSAKTGDGEAGWQAGKGVAANTLADNGGAYGLFLIPSQSTYTGPTAATGTLAATFYLQKGSLALSGNLPGGASHQGASALIKNSSGLASKYSFKMNIKPAVGAAKLVEFNFDKSSAKYIRKVFNTNPTLTNEGVTPQGARKEYWLGETYESNLHDVLDKAADVYGFLAPLERLVVKPDGNEKQNMGDFKGVEAQAGKSGWIIGQDLNALTSEYEPSEMPKLFRLVASEGLGGDWEQNNIKVSIMDIKPSPTEFEKYGSFTVAVRKVDDTDSNPQYVEVFTNCNLNPSSPNYVAAKIGDRHLVWDSLENRHKEIGDFPNNSKLIRVEMNQAAEQGALDPELLPFGFYGPPRAKTAVLEGESTGDGFIKLDGGLEAGNKLNIGAIGPTLFTASIGFPKLKLLDSASNAGVLDQTRAFFGVVATVGSPRPLAKLNEDYRDLVRAKSSGIDSYDADEDDGTEPSFIFSLDNIIVSGAAGESLHIRYQEGSRASGESYTALEAGKKDWILSEQRGTTVTASADHDYKDLLSREINKFSLPLFGGSDGLDIKEREPFRNELLGPDKTPQEHYAFNSIKRAIDSIKDPEVLDMNLLAIPGVTEKNLTNHAIDVCEDRADALAIIDLPGGYKPSSENDELEKDRVGSVEDTISSLKQRNLNSSFACTYYPWVKVLDGESGAPVWLPPSIAALGTMAYSQARSAVWFAPAGFNRGGLTLGSSGLDVVGVREKLTSKQRDALYEVNVNPIASFPSEGIVIFGQKTLQAVPSALDRINVRRMVLFVKKQISKIAANLLFEPNVEDTWSRFRGRVNPVLDAVKSGNGISEYKLVLDSSTTTAEEIDRNMMYAKLFIKPVYAIEFIGIDFVITNTGASFEDL